MNIITCNSETSLSFRQCGLVELANWFIFSLWTMWSPRYIRRQHIQIHMLYTHTTHKYSYAQYTFLSAKSRLLFQSPCSERQQGALCLHKISPGLAGDTAGCHTWQLMQTLTSHRSGRCQLHKSHKEKLPTQPIGKLWCLATRRSMAFLWHPYVIRQGLCQLVNSRLCQDRQID